MKKVTLLLVMIIAISLSFAAIDDFYTFNASAGTFTAITGTPVTDILADDALSAAIPIGFTFAYGENTFTEVKASSNGWVGLGTAQTSNALSNALASTTIRPVVAPLWDDLSMASGTVQYNVTGTAPNRVFTVQYQNAKWNYGATNQFTFQVMLYESGKVAFVYGPSTGTPANASASIGINMAPGGAGNYYSVTPGTPATVSSTTENTAIAAFPAQGTTYEFNPVVGAANDLAALSITGNTTPTVGQASPYTITVRNRGTNPQSTYSVKLFRGADIEVGTVAGTALAPGAITTFDIPWTPATEGITTLYGKVILAGDENATNDQTAPLTVNVQGSGTVVVTVGDGSQQARLPVDMYWMNSLFQTIYLASEINVGGLLTGIQFYNNFVTNLPNKPTKIWLAETTQTNLQDGWIPSTQMTLVFDGNVNYPAGPNNINIPFATPFVYGGGNLAMMVNRPLDTQYFSSSDFFQCQTVGTNRSRNVQADATTYDPANPPATATISGQFPKTTFYFVVSGMGTLSGTVYGPGNQPLADATVSIVGGTNTTTTNASGQYSFPYVNQGAIQVTATKHGYNSVTLPATIVEDQTTTLNFTLAQLANVTVTGTVVGSDQPTVGLSNATITLTGYSPYEATTNAQGVFTITGVYSGNTYNYTITRQGYQNATGTVTVGATNVNMGTITLNEIALPAGGVQAAIAGTNVNVTWSEPGTAGGEWIHYDSGENSDSIGTGGVADFDVAIRFPASALADYAGMSLHAVKVWPAQAGTFSVRVWTGGSPTAPAQMVADQAFTPELDTYNTVNLTTPVPITGNEELWFGYRCNVTSGYPAGCDAGPALDGFGNMMYWQNAWTTLLALAPSLNYNWNIQGYVGFSAPTLSKIDLQPLTFNFDRANSGELKASGLTKMATASSVSNERNDRVLTGYKVWRLLQGQETNENVWTLLTPNAITATAFTDGGWGALSDGWYKWAVKAVYTNDVMAPAAFSNALQKLTQVGTIAGLVRRANNVAIPGATVTASGVTATTNASGAYSMVVPAGSHTVSVTAAGFAPAQQTGVVVVTGQTTTVNFTLSPTGLVLTEGFEGTTFPPTGWTQTITDTGAANTYGVTPTWCRVGNVALTPAITPPEGQYQAGLWWSYNHQDEWLMTPQFQCPNAATLQFKSYVFFGSTYNDHYYVKVSTNNGQSWTELWDATTQTGGQQAYGPYLSISLAAYAGQNIKLAWHALNPPTNDGLWYVWFIDDVKVEGQVSGDDPGAPAVVTALNGNYPNPFNPETTINFSVKENAPVAIEIYNVKGQLVKTLVNEVKAAGNHSVVWTGQDNSGRAVTSGVYFYKMSTGKFSSTKKMILMK